MIYLKWMHLAHLFNDDNLESHIESVSFTMTNKFSLVFANK